MHKHATPLNKIFKSLLANNKVINLKDFAEQLEFQPIAISQMIRGLKPLNLRVLENLYTQFNVNINFLISEGKGFMFIGKEDEFETLKKDFDIRKARIDKQLQEISNENTSLKIRNKELEGRLQDKEEIIMYLKKMQEKRNDLNSINQ